MRTKVKAASPELALTRLVEALGQELIDAPEEEILEAAKELGMHLQMRGSAAFAGLKFPASWHLCDFFDLEASKRLQIAAERSAGAIQTKPKRKVGRTRAVEFLAQIKNPADK
jgi:formamidopyrimidine-DNA glycosylase